MPFIITSSSLSFFICTLTPLKIYSSFSDSLLEIRQAIVILQRVKKCRYQGKFHMERNFQFSGHRWSTLQVWERVWLDCFARSAPHIVMTCCSKHQRALIGLCQKYSKESRPLLRRSLTVSEPSPDLNLF